MKRNQAHDVKKPALRSMKAKMVFEAASYREFLREVLAEKKKQRKSYSLRAFARDLGVSSSLLSDVLLEKSNFSAASLERIAERLKLGESESEFFLLLASHDLERTKKGKARILAQIHADRRRREKPRELEEATYGQITDWFYSGILELAHLENFVATVRASAQRLGLSESVVANAFRKLEKLKLVERSLEGGFRRVDPALIFLPGPHSSAIDRFYIGMLKRLEGIIREAKPGRKRWSGYETFAVSREAYPEIKRACEKFMNEVVSIANSHPGKSNIMHLMVHAFELTEAFEETSR